MTLALLAVSTTLVAQDAQAPDPKTHQMPAAELVRVAVANEIAAADHPGVLHMFRSHKQTPRLSQTRLYVETTDALAAMLIAINDQPLNAEQQQGETTHLAWLMANPDQLRKKHAREKEDEQRTLQIVKALPNAFLYQYAGTENSEAGLGEAGDLLVKLTFTPNPAYSPPSRVEQVLDGMQGYLLIDAKARRITRIDGTLYRDVSFGWGILGRLDKGGHFLVQQADLALGDGAWGITEISLNVRGKLLLFKNLNMASDEVLSDFRKMPENLTFAQGVEILKAEQEKLAHNNHADQPHQDQPSEAQKAPQ
ncbi:MAG: hypothetical protein ACLPHP_14700 [Candidatus Sulfotelmatobacter sp.]